MAEAGKVSFFKTKHGKDGIAYEGYLFRMDNKRLADGSLLWRCLKEGCPGRIQTDASCENPRTRGREHDHLPDPEGCQVRSILSRMRERAANEATPVPKIYLEEAAALAAAPEVLEILPKRVSVSSSLYRARKKSNLLNTTPLSIVVEPDGEQTGTAEVKAAKRTSSRVPVAHKASYAREEDDLILLRCKRNNSDENFLFGQFVGASLQKLSQKRSSSAKLKIQQVLCDCEHEDMEDKLDKPPGT